MSKISKRLLIRHAKDESTIASTRANKSTKAEWMRFITAGLFMGGLLLLLVLSCVSPTHAYQLEGYKWPTPTTTFYVDIPGGGGLWNSSFENALGYWSGYTIFKYSIVRGVYEDPCDATEGRNGVGFESTACGDAWGDSVLAVCQSWYTGSTLTQTDIFFNSNYSWGVYSTSWQSNPKDFQRVALHELGHALGLDHENSGVATIMKSIVGNITVPQQDDINGVSALYGAVSLVNGVCGSSSGQTLATAPTTDLCSAGTASSVSGSGPWTWSCTGSNGGSTAYCSANKTVNTYSLGTALDNTDFLWTTGGNAPFTVETTASYYGGSSARTGQIGNNQSTYISTTVTGPGTLSFYWKVSSEQNYDFFTVHLDGVPKYDLSGDVAWYKYELAIPAGTHTVKWEYVKDSDVSSGQDAGWVDKVVFTSSASYLDYVDTVQKIFIGYYQRPADPVGLIYWADRLDRSGGNQSAIIEAFASSAEAQALYGAINGSNISTVVNDIYITLFGRPAEAGGLNYYANGFNAGRFTAATIMLNVLNGAQGGDLQSVNNKLTAANLFTRTIDPELDGINLQATYSGDGDNIAARNFLTLYATSVKVPTQAEVTAYIKNNIADPSDAINTTSAPTVASVYRHSAGSFEKSGNGWIEYPNYFTFEEQRTEGGYLYLYDPSRNIYLRIPIIGGMSQWSYTNPINWNNLYSVLPD